MNSQHQFDLIAESIHWLCRNQQNQPGLEELAEHVGLSPYYMQRLFQQWAGVSPKQFLKYLTKTQAMERLKQGQTVLDAAVSSGLSGPGRLHDLIVTTEAMTPGQAKQKGQGVQVSFGYGKTPFGKALLGWTDKGICFLGFAHDEGTDRLWTHFRQQWPDAIVSEDHSQAELKLRQIFTGSENKELKVWLRGSPFQLRIWEALLCLPAGVHCTYGQLASLTGNAGASRATGTAIGRNPVSWLIPCHRVINSLGTLGGYRWGINTKQAMIGYEAAQSDLRA